MPELNFEAAMTAHWLQMGIGPREAAAKLQPACGNVEPLSEAKLEALEAKWRQERDAFGIILAILAEWNRWAGFDCEDVGWPADHAHIVRYLAAVTGNQFAAEDIVQTDEPNDVIRLTFTHRGNPYSFTFESHGTWVNVTGMLNGLNQILELLGMQERFIELYNAGGQASIVVFALPSVFLPAACELHIRLESPPNVKYD